MATTVLAIGSERVGLSTLSGTVSNIDNVDVNENYQLPPGYGDCMIHGIMFQVSGITTVVANPELRGPVVYIMSTSIVDFIGGMRTWRKVNALATALVSQWEMERPVLLRATELLQVQFANEDTGAGDTADVYCALRVLRLRNLGL